ncbi:MAG TPA: DUF1345 domain-containing protein [Allosphingosinicella sp.]|jgi:uncharacterized membrane protein
MTGRTRRSIGNRVAPARFILFVVALAASTAGLILSRLVDTRQAAMIGFDAAALLFLLSCIPLVASGDAATMRGHAERNDANRTLLLAVTGAVMFAILVAVASEVAGGGPEPAQKLLVLATLVLAWLFSNTVYALHYAHLCYSPDGERRGGHQGLDFPDTPAPDYVDFAYFAFTLGMTFQTSDVSITSRRIRRIVTVHCLAAFVFNLGVLAFTINVLGSH